MIDVRQEYTKALRAIPPTVRALVRGVDDATARRRPAEGEWSLVEVVAHMADVDERARERVERILDEDDPELAPFDQDALAESERYRDRALADEVERLATTRAAHLDLLDSLGDEQWERTGRHGEHGRMTVRDYEAHCAAEDVDHLAQIAETLAVVTS